MECNVFLKKINETAVRRSIKKLIRNNGNKEIFVKDFINVDGIPKQFRYTLTKLDSDDIIQQSITSFIKVFDNVERELINENPSLEAVIEDLKNYVFSILHVDLDESLSGSNGEINTEDFIEAKTQKEERDIYINKYEEHIIDIYGSSAHNIKVSLEKEFKEDIISAAFRDKYTGNLISRDNLILNRNFLDLKNKYYNRIVKFLSLESSYTYKDLANILKYILQNKPEEATKLLELKKKNIKEYKTYRNSLVDLVIKELNLSKKKILKSFMADENYEFIGAEYYDVLNMFYKHILKLKKLGLFEEELVRNSTDAITQDSKFQKNKIYELILDTLKKNEEFNTKLNNTYKTKKLLSAVNLLYIANHFSPYYVTVKNIIKQLGLGKTKIDNQTIDDLIQSIESDDINLLTATEAYTFLRHFDSLLKISNDNFEIKEGLENVEFVDMKKYSHHISTAHERKNWQTSESIDTEAHTADLVKNILEQIDIFSYKTDVYQNKTVNLTSFITASRNLMNEVLLGNNTWRYSGGSKHQQQVFSEFIDHFNHFHDNPLRHFLKILEMMFDIKLGLNREPLYESLSNNKILTDYDMNILYSVYHAIFNKNNPTSLINKEYDKFKANNGCLSLLVSEFSGTIDRNVNIDYLEVDYDYAELKSVIKMKRKYYNNLEVITSIKNLNYTSNKRGDSVKKIVDKYQFNIQEGIKGYNLYSINLENLQVSIEVPASSLYLILFNDPGIKFNNELFLKLNAIDLIQFREKLIKNNLSNLTANEKILYNMLLFLEDTLDIKFISQASEILNVLEAFKNIYNPNNLEYNRTGGDHILGKYYLMPLVQLAMRVMYVKNLYASMAEGETLKEYLVRTEDSIYSHSLNNPKAKIFTNKYNNVQYIVASNYDTVLEMWADAKSMVNGESSKSTTKDKFQNNIPNNSVSKMGSLIHYFANKLRDIDGNSNVDSLFFVNNTDLIVNIFHDLEVSTMSLDKQVKSFSSGELFYHAIFNKFWRNYLDTGNIIVQPTVYSDKTTFLNYEINTKFIGNKKEDLMTYKGYQGYIIDQYTLTIGTAYKEIWKSTKRKLLLIASKYNLDNGTNLTFKLVLNKLSEPQLIKLGKEVGVDLELDKDYRIIKTENGKVTSYNEELEYFSEVLYNDKNKLKEYLENQKGIFLSNLLNSGNSFQVLDYKDNFDYYLSEDKINEKAVSKNVFIDIILKLYKNKDRVEFFKKWVDPETGKLILAKLKGRNIIDSRDVFERKDSIELNPILDKFFYVEGFMSNNIRLSLTGSEINHPDKAFDTSYKHIKKSKDILEAFENTYIASLNKSTQELVLKLIKSTVSVGDLYQMIFETDYPEPIKKALRDIYEHSLLTMTNVSQGTLFKRNVIIPATLLYCLSKNINGISPKTKCAVIRDEEAAVWNYRGDHEGDIDSADGSAWIDPFQSILENMALGSQAVGFVKKPIWHSYDSQSGTAFLAKFATDTITNEVMQASINSHTNMYNLFKKMTNLLWLEDVDLMEAIGFGVVSKLLDKLRRFNVSLLGNSIYYNAKGLELYTEDNKLLYKNQYGDIIEIKGFDKVNTAIGPIYYTLEKPFGYKVECNNVYHVFYDKKSPDGKIQKSTHITFDTYLKAVAFIKNNPGAHSINSLYELHTSLGGLNNVDSKGNSSEFVNLVVVNFMNTVGHVKPGHEKDTTIDLDSYELPLKNYHIGYALNNTAVKNGAKNINQSSAWYDDSELGYFEVDSDGLGMQMNADHDIVDSELTEFSQVITATAAYGYTHENTNEIFLGLAFTALEASNTTLKAVDAFLETTNDPIKAKSDLYDAIGRIIFVNKSIKDKENLQGIIMEAVNKIFYKQSDHTDDEVKIPFSDANVYSDFISTLASTITKLSIKRKHPGSGCVMAPGFNIILYFEVDGYKLNAQEIITLALEDYKLEILNALKSTEFYKEDINSIVIKDKIYNLSTILPLEAEELIKTLKLEDLISYKHNLSDITDINKFFIDIYLNKKQGEAQVFEDNSWFMPSDNVDILYNNPEYNENTEEGKVLPLYITQTVELDSLDTYYKFKEGLFEIEHDYQVSIKPNYSKGKYEIALAEDLNQKFILEPEFEIDPVSEKKTPTGNYNIHFKTGGFNSKTLRRTVSTLTEEQKERLFNAALETLPIGSVLRLSPTTKEQYDSGQGGLTSGSIAGFNSIFENSKRRKNVDLDRIGEGESVFYFDNDGNPQTAIVYKYKKIRQNSKTNKYRINISKPHNLRPSLIRWKYIKDGLETYMNIFDTKTIKEAYTKPYNRSKSYRNEILIVLNNLNEGFFTDSLGNKISVIEGSLENTQAELVMSNLHKDKFGITNESLNLILKLGRNFFLPSKRDRNKLNTPHNPVYDLAFLKDSGIHTLVTLGEILTNEYISNNDFNLNELTTNEDGDIYYVKRNKLVFKVGKWVDYSDKVIYENGLFLNSKTKEVLENLEQYRLPDSDNPVKIEKRFDFVKRYTFIDKYTLGSKIGYKKNTLYQIANLLEIEEALGNKLDAAKQRRKILVNMYLADSYKLAYVNKDKVFNESKLEHIKSAVSWILENTLIETSVKNLLSKLLETLEVSSNKIKKPKTLEDKKELIKEFKKTEAINSKTYEELLENFYLELADKKWASFQDSLLYISSRIPAQTLQSFMSMKLVGWTNNTKNMAYVSHFLTYLQGSDYDIDKAYIMSLSYDSNGVYIGWSNLFDYSSYETLEASKTLPVPKNSSNNPDKYIKFDTNEGAEISEYLEILKSLEGKTDVNSKAKRIRTFSKILLKVELNNFKIKLVDPTDFDNQILKILNSHELYKIPINNAESAYKNVASANIYSVIDDIRNRDQAYTAISMDILKKAAAGSPKGNLAAELNMLNPLTKYIMQYQNLVGKNVISIAANGEKVWFNAFYYWTLVLKYGTELDIQKLKFSLTLNRIKGRAKYLDALKNHRELPEISSSTVTHLPDLNIYDETIKTKLLEEFGATEDSLAYKEVDQLISQLLSAATDNAKELILAKINAGTNFARMYVYLMMTGFSIDDIVAFMTSPMAEFIDAKAAQNIFLNNDDANYATNAIKLALGLVNINNFLHGSITQERDEGAITVNKHTYLLKNFNNLDDDFLLKIKQELGLDVDDRFTSLDLAMLGLILCCVRYNLNPEFDLISLDNSDREINNYIRYCSILIDNLKAVRNNPLYNSFDDFLLDALEFYKIYNLSTEISTISSKWLGLNQGLPTDEFGILKRLNDMSKIVSNRESILGIKVNNLYPDSYKSYGKNLREGEYLKNKDKFIRESIIANNPSISYEEALRRLDSAYEALIINNFDIIRYLLDNDYKNKVIDYYGLIMGTLNVFHMMEVIPHYKAILKCLRSLVTSNNTLSIKSKLINDLLSSTEGNITDSQLKGAIKYIDNLNIYNYFETLKPITLNLSIVGYDPYFKEIKVNKIELNSLNGMATLKHWVENEFKDLLSEQSKNPNSEIYNNGFIKHLKLVVTRDNECLATDIDLMNPNTTISSRLAYEDILRGISLLSKIPYRVNGVKTEYSLADIFQLYNLVVNQNQYGSLRLTTIFKVLVDSDNLINKYLKYIGSLDYNSPDIKYNYTDFLINSAPVITLYTEKFHQEKFVKVKDPVEGLILKEYDYLSKEYKPKSVVLNYVASEDPIEYYKRLLNYFELCPLELIYSHKNKFKSKILTFNNFSNLNEYEQSTLKEDLLNLLKNYSMSNQILLFKNCY